MDIFSLSWIGFILTGLGTLFLIGEILVNMRGFFAVLGIGFMVVYFSAYLEPASIAIMLVIYFVGLLLIIIDGKLLNDGTLAVIGIASMLTSVALAAPDLYVGLYAIIGVLVGAGGSFFFLKVFKRRNLWNKLALTDRLTKEAGYSSMNKTYENLVGLQGVTLHIMRPVGTIRIADQDYSAISDGQWIDKDTTVEVVAVDGTRILVKPIDSEDI